MASSDKEKQARKHARVNGDPSREPEADPNKISLTDRKII